MDHMRADLFSRWCVLIALSATTVWWSSSRASEPGEYAEYEVKAAFLLSFALFVEWPQEALPDTAGQLTIGLLGDDLFGEALTSIADKPVKGRRLQVKRSGELRDLDSCHILFISPSERKRLPRILEDLGNGAVLVIGESEGFAEAGGMIGFYLQGKKVRFEINPDAAARAGLEVSSKLLNLARIVEDRQKEGRSR